MVKHVYLPFRLLAYMICISGKEILKKSLRSSSFEEKLPERMFRDIPQLKVVFLALCPN